LKELPFFKWFPADAETDAFYASLSYEALGLYHRMLNLAWINNGLPSDLEELASVIRVERSFLDKYWPKLSKRWVERDGMLFNSKQEEERADALEKSQKASEAAKARYGRNANAVHPQCERNANAPIRASVSVSDSSSEVKNKTSFCAIPKMPQGFDFQAWIAERDRKHPIPGKPQLAIQYALEHIFKDFQPEEFSRAHDAWCAYWKGQDGGIPTLAIFISEAWYRKQPPIREPPKRKDFVSDVTRVIEKRIRETGKPW
jgi:uncharacterized protein YdaU (DUF1376 family)